MSAFVPAIMPEHSGFTPNTQRNLSIGRHVEFSHVGEIAEGKDMAHATLKAREIGEADPAGFPKRISKMQMLNGIIMRLSRCKRCTCRSSRLLAVRGGAGWLRSRDRRPPVACTAQVEAHFFLL